MATTPTPAPRAPKALPAWECYALTLQFRERVYGGIPKQQHVFDSWQAAKQSRIPMVEPTPEELARGLISAAEMAARMAEEDRAEVGELDEEVEAGETVFRRDATGLYLRQFQLKAACKESAQRLGLYQSLKRNADGMGLRSHVQTGVYIHPRNLYLRRDGKPLTEPDGSDEAQGRVPTPKGPKSILRKSEYVERAVIEAEIHLLPFKGFSEPELMRVLALAQEIGLGAWRAREEGTFDVVAFTRRPDRPLTLGNPDGATRPAGG